MTKKLNIPFSPPDITEEEIQAVEEWINKYPRRIHGYKSAGQLFDEELKRIS